MLVTPVARFGRHMFLTKKEYVSMLVTQHLLDDNHDY